jgi:hypothetical protein
MTTAMNMAMKKTTLHAAAACAALLAGAWTLPAAAQDADVLVKHTAISAGQDGVKRTSEFAERIVRRQDQVWIERVVPAGWHTADDHSKADKSHKHLDTAAAARWITRGVDGTAGVRLASREDKVLVEVAKTDFENVGFDGSWAAAYYLIDPAALKRMKVTATQGDLTTYTSADTNRQLKIIWNDKLKLPVLVESRSGASSKRTTVEVSAQAKTLPWDGIKSYARKDYSDYLD